MAYMPRLPCDAGVIRSGPQTAPCEPRREPWILAAMILGSSMVFIDGTVVNVMLPELQRTFSAGVAEIQWVVVGYTLFLAALLLVGGSLGDHYGRRRVFAIGTTLFAIASVGCGLAQSVNQLIAVRALQGVGGALLVPGSLAIISASFSREQRGRAIGTWSGFTAISAGLGPVFGGWLIDQFSWRWAFFINVPLAAVAIAILYWQVNESRDEDASGRLDWIGAALVTAGLGAIVYGLIESANLGLGHPVVMIAILLGVAMLIAFVAVEARSKAPMVPLNLFRSRNFSGANLLTLLLYAAMIGATFYLPLNLIQVQGYSATSAGAAMLPFVSLMFLLSRWAGGLIEHYGARPPLIIGPLITSVGLVFLALQGIGGSYWTTYFPAIAMLGLGVAVTVAPLTTTVMSAVDSRHSGVASGINNAVSRTAGVLAITVMSVVMLASFSNNLDGRLSTMDLPTETRQALEEERVRLAGAEIPSDLQPDTAEALEGAINEAFVESFRQVVFVAAGLALAGAISAYFVIERSAETFEAATAEAGKALKV